jgi:hypothetical protein
MSKDIYTKIIDDLGDELITNKVKENSSFLMDKLLPLINSKAEDYKLHKIKPTEEQLKADVQVFLEIIANSMANSKEYNDTKYKKSYEGLKALVDEGKDWKYIFTEIYEDQNFLNNIFIRLIEEHEEVAITSAKQLQELSGITELYGYWDEVTEETKPYKGIKKPTKKEAQEEAVIQIEDTFIQGMYDRYFTTLEGMLEAGAKYKDLLLIEPKHFNLPETWSGTLSKDKYNTMLWAISFTYLINEPAGLMMLPDLRSIAKEIEAPYSVVMDCFKLFNK